MSCDLDRFTQGRTDAAVRLCDRANGFTWTACPVRLDLAGVTLTGDGHAPYRTGPQMPEGVDMRSCAACGGLIGEPGKAYGYAGRWCHCTKPLPNDYPHVQGFPHIQGGFMPPPSRIEDLVKSPLTPINTTTFAPTPMAQRITPTEFVHWLKGYFAAGGPNTLNQADFKRIAEELKRVHT